MYGSTFGQRTLAVIVVAVLVPLALPVVAATSPTSWRMVDLGAGDHSTASAINDRGHVVGTLGSGDGFLWRDGRLTDLGSFRPTDINNRDEVVGYRLGDDTLRAVLWRAGAVTELASPPGGSSYASALNDRTEVVGWTLSSDGFRRGFLWRDGTMAALGGAATSVAHDINNRGQIVGAAGVNTPEIAVRWWRGSMTRLGVVATEAWAVNEVGAVTGPYWSATATEGFVWQRGRFIELPPQGIDDRFIQPYGINNRTQVVGTSAVGAFVWEKGRTTILPALTRASGAFDINDHGVIAGENPTTTEGLTPHAVIWIR